jgi:hypothetical protein
MGAKFSFEKAIQCGSIGLWRENQGVRAGMFASADSVVFAQEAVSEVEAQAQDQKEWVSWGRSVGCHGKNGC